MMAIKTYTPSFDGQVYYAWDAGCDQNWYECGIVTGIMAFGVKTPSESPGTGVGVTKKGFAQFDLTEDPIPEGATIVSMSISITPYTTNGVETGIREVPEKVDNYYPDFPKEWFDLLGPQTSYAEFYPEVETRTELELVSAAITEFETHRDWFVVSFHAGTTGDSYIYSHSNSGAPQKQPVLTIEYTPAASVRRRFVCT